LEFGCIGKKGRGVEVKRKEGEKMGWVIFEGRSRGVRRESGNVL
jgi:hypothetical protein